MAMRAAFHNLGCRVNAYETEAMLEQLRLDGYRIVPFDEEADVYVVNTCTVTHIADRKSRQMLRRAREMNAAAVIVATGCYVEDAGTALLDDGTVDLFVGNSAKSRLADILRLYLHGDERRVYQEPIQAVREYDAMKITRAEGKTRAFLKIEDGCNRFCSYCMIPYVRGRVRSRPEEEILKEAESLVRAGYREIVLTGIHISSYGMDLDYPGENRQTPCASRAETNVRLLTLMRKTSAIPGLVRLRFGSMEPGIMTEEFVRSMTELPAVCPEFHLSLQSGCDETLARMKRKYDTDSYERICGRLRSAFANPAITTDVIAGFPGETEEEFEKTEAFLKKIGFAGIHVFKYSRREGTKAADYPDQVPEQVRKERSDALLQLGRKMRRAYAESFAGKEVEVLIEEENRGHTREMLDAVCLPD